MPELQFDPSEILYTSDVNAWRLDQLAEVLDELYAAGKPLVIFVHGRGKEPHKSLLGATFVQGRAVDKSIPRSRNAN